MYHRPSCGSSNYKISGRQHRRKPLRPLVSQIFLSKINKSQAVKEYR